MEKLKKESWRVISISLLAIGLVLSLYPLIVGSNTIDGNWEINTLDTINLPVDGLYYCPLKICPMDFDPDAIDQYNVNFEGSPPLNYAVSNEAWMMQYGFDDREPLTGFSIAISQHGTPTEGLYLGLMFSTQDPNNQNNWRMIGYLEAGVLPQQDTFYWVGFDFTNNPLNPPIDKNVEWCIVCISDQDWHTGNWWGWAVRDDNPYSRGSMRHWDGTTWQPNTAYDLLFITYTIPGSQPPPDEPAISISTTSHVISAFGLGFLGMTVMTGSKYFGWI